MSNRFRPRLSRSPPEPTPPVPFGYKTGWIAVRSTDAQAVADVLPVRVQTAANWEIGIDAAYKGSVFITPPINEWICIIGAWAMGSGKADSVDVISKRVAELSSRFGEAQGYATNRIVEYHHWIMAKQGQVVRCFEYLGERGEILRNTGSITDAERKLLFANQPTDQWMPDEDDVMTVASKWSFDPTKLSSESGPAVNGIFVRMK